MKTGGETGSVFVRFRLMTWLGALFCFVLVPALLINQGLGSMLELRSENERARVFKEMDDRLNFLTRNADESHYYHSLLKNAFNRALASDNPAVAIGKNLQRLRARFPGALRFIVWDAKGRVIDHLTDEKSYRYIVNNLYYFFNEIAAHCRASYPGFPELLPVVEKRINLFRSYLGRFLVPHHLRLPFQAGEHGRCILADSKDGYPLFWFDSRAELTLFCSIKPSVDENPGVRHAIELLNRDDSPIISGYIDLKRLGSLTAEIGSDEQRQLLIELGKYENAALPHRNTNDFLMAFKLLTPDLRGFCLLHKRNLTIGYPDQRKMAILVRMAIAIALILAIFYCYSLRLTRVNVSIRTRIAFLFLYANGLPLMILGTIGHEYLQQRENSLIQDAHRVNERILQEMDSGYRRQKKVMNRATVNELASFTASVVGRLPDKSDTEELKRVVHALNAEEISVYGLGGETIMTYKRNRKPTAQTFMRMFAASALSFSNQGISDFGLRDKSGGKSSLALTSNSIVNDHRSLLENMLATLEAVGLYTFGTESKLCFARLLGDRRTRSFHSVMVLSWRIEDTQAAYASLQVGRGNQEAGGLKFAAIARHNGVMFCDETISQEKLRPVMQKAFNLQSARENNLVINGRNFLVTAIAGRQMDSIALAVVAPADYIADDIRQTEKQMLLLVMLSLFIVSAVVTALSRQFLMPVRQLADAVRQIGRRNFGFRTSIESADEFGELGGVFNLTMEGMGELEIGRVVQDALLPDPDYRKNRISIYAKTATMTRLGGDYFDFVRLENNQTGVFMGDVAGHGIPAALIMAMAKTTVLVNRSLLGDPARLLGSLHDMLFKLKSDGFKRMMTCQYILINDMSGECQLANAGHCFPVVVGPQGRTSRLEEIIGTPVGIARKARYQNYPVMLNPGETMILYSDGMLEAANAAGEIFGTDQLLDLARNAWHENLQQYYVNLFSANRAWSKSVEDDLTIVLIRFGEESR